MKPNMYLTILRNLRRQIQHLTETEIKKYFTSEQLLFWTHHKCEEIPVGKLIFKRCTKCSYYIEPKPSPMSRYEMSKLNIFTNAIADHRRYCGKYQCLIIDMVLNIESRSFPKCVNPIRIDLADPKFEEKFVLTVTQIVKGTLDVN